MLDVNKLIQIALAEVGYREKASNTLLDDRTANAGVANFTKYARDIDNIPNFYNGAKNGYAWCDVFVDWCFIQAFGVDLAKALLCQPDASTGAGCTYSARFYQEKGQLLFDNPLPGDQIFFGTEADCYHTGLVVAVDGNTITTVEGNASDGVCQCKYGLSDGRIYAYGRPNYAAYTSAGDEAKPPTEAAEQPTEDNKCTVVLDIIRFGYRGLQAKLMQTCLIYRGYTVGIDGADGDFGNNTLSGLNRFKEDRNLPADGICDKQTWEKLLY